MLCSKFKQIISTKSSLNINANYRYFFTSRFALKKWAYIDGFLTNLCLEEGARNMSSMRILLKDIRFWSAWTRRTIVSTVVKKCRRDRSVREVIQCFRQAIFRPRRTFLLAATAAYKSHDDDKESPPSSKNSITDEELKALLTELECVETLSKDTLFCQDCGKRLVIDKKQNGVKYCGCTNVVPAAESVDGWVPYMEAEDVVIWRKEYKPGQGLYAYKVYGRYSEVRASDFAAVQVDSGYRREWDAAVASLAVVERSANGLPDQAVLHWEVLWPRLFANRDYVYLRRHKEFEVISKSLPHKDSLFHARVCEHPTKPDVERPSVHSNAKRKSMEAYERERDGDVKDKVYVIVSRSCEHSQVPETKHAIRVTEYWSNMVVKTLDGTDKAGMEFVLTYYDEPAVGGMPSSVATWATGRAAPAYLQRMRHAASHYRAWRYDQPEELPDCVPFMNETTSQKQEEEQEIAPMSEADMETSKEGPELEGEAPARRDQSTQTEDVQPPPTPQTVPTPKVVQITNETTVKADKAVNTDMSRKILDDIIKEDSSLAEAEEETVEEGESAENARWWRYLYPFYYSV